MSANTDPQDDERQLDLALSNGMLLVCTLVAGAATVLSFLLPQ